LFPIAILFTAAGIVPAPEPGIADRSTTERIDEVSIRGSSLPWDFETRAGTELDPGTVSKDVRALWNSGRFKDVRAILENTPGRQAVIFDVVEKRKLFLRKVSIEPENPGVKLHLEEGSPLDEPRAQQVASELRRHLEQDGFPEAQVEPRLEPVGAEKADLRLYVETGERRRMGKVELAGELGLRPDEIRRALRATKSRTILPTFGGLWRGWTLRPAWSEEAVESDAARLRSLYISRGYFDAAVMPEIEERNSLANLRFRLQPGSRYDIRTLRTAGAPPAEMPGEAGPGALCTGLLRERRAAEEAGVLDFSAGLNIEQTSGNAVDLGLTVGRGKAFRIGRIQFAGHHRFGDASVRRHILLDEGDLLDQTKLHKSFYRLNRTGFFEPLGGLNVAILRDEEHGIANLSISLKERKRGRWFISGPAFPGIGGPLQFAISSRLPAWGAGLFELSTYQASVQVLGAAAPLLRIPGLFGKRTWRPVISLDRPLIASNPWLSGFAIAPQFGWRSMAAHYGITHGREMLGFLNTAPAAPPLAVPVSRGEQPLGVMYCEPPGPRLVWLRRSANLAMQFLLAAPF
jgi:Surface antigen variable number repeat